MQNPFEFGGIVQQHAFCNRKQELRDLRRAAENGDRLLVYAERRMGKTSLVKKVLAGLPKKTFLPLYVDIWATHDAASLAATIARAVTEQATSRKEQMLQTAKELFRYLVPALTLDEAGNPSIQFGARSGMEVQPQLEDVLDAPQRLAAQRKRQVVVVLDEIQRLAEYEDDLAERVLRSRIQTHSRIAYLFLGSRKHLIEQMFLDVQRPLFRSAGHYPLGPIDTKNWIPFISSRFSEAGKPIESDLVDDLCRRTLGHPYYTQQLAHVLWEISPESTPVGHAELDEAESVLLQRLSYTYTVLWESLTTNQKIVLQGLATEDTGVQPFSSTFVQKYGIAPSSAHVAARALVERDVLDRSPSGYSVSDRFLRLWIMRTLGER